MSSRTRKIVAMAKNLNSNDIEIVNEDHEQENAPNLSNISDFNHKSFLELNLEQILSPEDISELINNAEVVFESSSSDQMANFEVSKPTASDPSFQINNVEASLEQSSDQSVANSSTNPVIPEENIIIISDPDYDATMESDNAESSEESLDEDISDQEPQEQISGEDSDLEGQPASENETKKRKGYNKRAINKRLRLTGKSYLGFTKPKNQKNTFQNKKRDERKIKERCKCPNKEQVKNATRKCSLISDQDRKKVFKKFWDDMTWEQRKVFVVNTVRVCYTKRPSKKIETSRRSQTLSYSFVINNQSIPVCKKMYLNTLSIGEWSVRSWTMKYENGMANSNQSEISNREKREDIFENDRRFLNEFLQNLNKLPSHYCRKDTNRMYLEQSFQSWSDLYRAYKEQCQEKGQNPMSIITMTKLADQMKISIFRPRKDQCDVCFKYKNDNVEAKEYQKHIENKNLARREKEIDKEKAINGEFHMITMDVQAVKLSPQIPASTLYYKQKLCCHNFTIYNLVNNQAVCYWFNETVADGQASVYASCLIDYLEGQLLTQEVKRPIIIYSDGCTAQNRNSVLANALLYLSDKYDILITQKFLEKGHTQMECDSVHSAIETCLKNKEIYLPSDYLRITKLARIKNPYLVKTMDYDFFKNYGHKDFLKYASIRPSRINNDDRAIVTNIRALKYWDGQISFKLSFCDEDFYPFPIRPKKVDFKNVIFPPLYQSPLPITKKKYDNLQSIKATIPKDCWSFYEQLPYK